MEFTRRCSVCGKIYCYTDQDLKDSKTNAVAGAIGAIGTIASVFGGTPYQTFELDKMSDRAMNKMIDYEKCPNCGSSRTVLLTADELAKYKSSDHTTPVANPQMPQMVPINTNASTESLVERGMLFLEDQEWDKANAYFENVLDADPKNVQAYIGKLLVDFRISRVELLDSCEKDFTDNPNYKKALRFSTEKEKEQLDSINKERIYKKAKTVSRTDYKKAIDLLATIKDYKDASQLIDSYSEIININIYEKALSEKESESISKLTEAAGLLDGLGDYKEAKKIAAEYRSRIEGLRAEEEKKRQEEAKRAAAIAEEREKQAAKEAEKEAEIQKQQREKRKKYIIFASAFAVIIIAVYMIVLKMIIPNNKYNAAVSLMEKEEYDAALQAFQDMKGYKDTDEKILECENWITYQNAKKSLESDDYFNAIQGFSSLNDFQDSEKLFEECKPLFYDNVTNEILTASYETKDYTPLKDALLLIQDYKDVNQFITCINGITAYKEERYKDSFDSFKAISPDFAAKHKEWYEGWYSASIYTYITNEEKITIEKAIELYALVPESHLADGKEFFDMLSDFKKCTGKYRRQKDLTEGSILGPLYLNVSSYWLEKGNVMVDVQYDNYSGTYETGTVSVLKDEDDYDFLITTIGIDSTSDKDDVFIRIGASQASILYNTTSRFVKGEICVRE